MWSRRLASSFAVHICNGVTFFHHFNRTNCHLMNSIFNEKNNSPLLSAWNALQQVHVYTRRLRNIPIFRNVSTNYVEPYSNVAIKMKTYMTGSTTNNFKLSKSVADEPKFVNCFSEKIRIGLRRHNIWHCFMNRLQMIHMKYHIICSEKQKNNQNVVCCSCVIWQWIPSAAQSQDSNKEIGE